MDNRERTAFEVFGACQAQNSKHLAERPFDEGGGPVAGAIGSGS